MIIEFTQNKRFLRVYINDTLPSIILYISITIDAIIIFISHIAHAVYYYTIL